MYIGKENQDHSMDEKNRRPPYRRQSAPVSSHIGYQRTGCIAQPSRASQTPFAVRLPFSLGALKFDIFSCAPGKSVVK